MAWRFPDAKMANDSNDSPVVRLGAALERCYRLETAQSSSGRQKQSLVEGAYCRHAEYVTTLRCSIVEDEDARAFALPSSPIADPVFYGDYDIAVWLITNHAFGCPVIFLVAHACLVWCRLPWLQNFGTLTARNNSTALCSCIGLVLCQHHRTPAHLLLAVLRTKAQSCLAFTPGS